MQRRILLRAALAFATVAAAIGGTGAGAEARTITEHDRIVAFWTNERVAKAVPRDFVRDASARRFLPAARPGTGGSSGAVTGSSWTSGGAVLKTTGKVLFAMGTSYYVCSASVVNDTVAERSIILTAGHCLYDETNKKFATNWMFIPDYDSKPAALTTNGSFCANTSYGCWTASSLVVSAGFANAGGFNDTAILHDYAFAVVGVGGKLGTHLDVAVGGQRISFNGYASGTETYLFGYPASQKYKGNDLVHSRGPLGFDPNAGNRTYRVTSDMTGGSSGGPWFAGFDPRNGVGTLMSVNSYGYSGVTAMHGPMLNSETAAMFSAAGTALLGTNVVHG